MADLLAQLIPTAIVGALSPLPVLVVIVLLMSERGLAKAASFAAALVGGYAVVGAVVLAVADGDAAESDGGRAVAGAVVAAIGAMLVVLALKQLVGGPDPDEALPKLMGQLDRMTPGRTALLGVAVGLLNVKQLGIFIAGIAQIVAADLTGGQAWIALALLVVLIQSVVIVAVVGFAVAPGPATRRLQSVQAWLTRNKRVISIVLGLVIGAAFVVKGVTMITG
jgi:threonine/homoserine/homoserine lactone efflux protein